MTRLSVLGALLPVLMTTTALGADEVAPEAIVEEEPLLFTLSGTAGVIGFNLPDFETGINGITDDNNLWGGMVGVSGSGVIGNGDLLNLGGWDLIFGFNAFVAIANSDHETSSWSPNGPGTLVITGLTTPSGGDNSIVLTTNGGVPSASADIDANNPQGDDEVSTLVSATGGGTNAADVSPSDPFNSFILGAATTSDGEADADGEAAAYGAIADTSGGVFVASGDIDDLDIETTTKRQLIYLGGDVTLGLAGDIGDGSAGQVYLGPSFRLLSLSDRTDININIPEVEQDLDEGETAVIMPDFTISTDGDVESAYLGGVLGGQFSFLASEGVTFTLGVEGGAYGVRASWTGRDRYSTCCGLFDPPGGEEVFLPSPNLTVRSDEISADFDAENTVAFAARGTGAVTWAIQDGLALSLGGSIEYLSKVATVDHNRTTFVSGDDNITWENDDNPPVATVNWGSMFDFALTASITGQF